MATTETFAPLPVPTTDDEQAEKKGSEEKKADDPICLETPAVDHEKIKPVVEVEKIVDAPVTVLDEPKVGNDPVPGRIELPVEAEKNADAAVSDVPVVEESKVECEPIPDVPAEVVDPVNIPEEVESSTESVVREAPKEPAIEIIGEGQVEQTKIVPQYSYEAIEKTEEPLQVTTDKESVETVPTEIKESEPESLEVHKPELAAEEVEEKPGEPCEVTREVETKLEEVALQKNVQDETVKDEGSAADIVEPIPFSEEGKSEAENTPSVEVEEAPEQPKVIEEEKTRDEVVPEKCLEDDIVKDEGSNKVEALTISEKERTDKDYVPSQVEPGEVLLNGNGADYSLPDSTEADAPQDQKKGVTEVDVVDKIQEEAAVEIKKFGEVPEAKETEKDIVASTEPIKEEEKEGLNGIEVVEKPAEEAPVELVTAAEENEETLEIQEKEKSNVVTEKSTQSIELDEKKEPSGLEGVKKLADEESVKLESVEKQNAETLEIEEKENSNVVAEESSQPIELDEKKERGLDVVEKLKEEEAVEVEKVKEKKVETEDGNSVITEDTVQPRYEDEKKDLSEANVIEKSTDETGVKLKEVGEEDVVKIAESEKKDEIIENSSQPILADQNKESNGVDEVEKLPEESEKAEEVIETKNVQSEDSDSKTVIEEVLTQQDKADVNSYISTPSEVTEKSIEEALKDVEPAAQTEKEEHIKVETPGVVETKKEDNVEEKQDEVKPSEPEVKGDEPVTLEKTTEDVAESDRNVELPAKDGDDTKPSEDLSKEVPAKTSPKQSNTILSKVKHTLVKAKRVITGKSPSSKTPASETKEDIKVK